MPEIENFVYYYYVYRVLHCESVMDKLLFSI